MLSEVITHEKCTAWNGCDDALKEDIRKNDFVKRVRRELIIKKKLKNRLKS